MGGNSIMATLPKGFVIEEQESALVMPEGFVIEQQSVSDAPQEDFSVSEMVGNIPSSALQLGRDIIEPLLNPIDTAKSIGELGSGALFKANEAISEVMPESLDFMSKPLMGGDDVFGSQQAHVAEAVGDFINERYGSVDAFKDTVQNDPVGALADIAGLMTGGSTLIPKAGKAAVIGEKVAALGKAVDPLNISVSAIKAAAKGGKVIPQALPEKLLESALKFRPSIKPSQRASMTKTALKEGILPTVSGLEKIANKMNDLNTNLDNIIDTATVDGAAIPKGVVFSELKKLRRDLGGVKINATSDLRVIDKMAKDFDLNLRRLGKDKITPRELQDLKTDAYKRINFDVKSGTAEAAKSATSKAIAKGGKEALERLNPNVKGINQRMGSLLELNNELESVVSRLDNRNLISLDTAAKVAAGAATGTPTGTAIGTGAAVAGNPRVKARAAMALENIRRNAETIKIINNKLPPVLARSLLDQAGKLNDALSQQVDEAE
jgi:hypothetical protein